MALFVLFVFYPFGKTIFLSAHTTDPTGTVISYAGIGNFINLFKSADFIFSLGVTFRFALIVVAGSMVMGIVTGIIANEKFPLRSMFRTVYAMPLAVSSACISVICLFIMHPTLGILNYLLDANIKWLMNPKFALYSVAAVTIWMNIGLNFIFTIAALQSVDISLYEAAAIEGVGFFRKHWHVTMPSISPTLFFLLIINIINSFQSYAQINLLTKGGPGNYTTNIVYLIYNEAFIYNRFGPAAAMSIVLFVIILLLTLAQFALEKKVTY